MRDVFFKLTYQREGSLSSRMALPSDRKKHSNLDQPIYPVDSPSEPIANPGFCRGLPMGNIVNYGDFRIE